MKKFNTKTIFTIAFRVLTVVFFAILLFVIGQTAGISEELNVAQNGTTSRYADFNAKTLTLYSNSIKQNNYASAEAYVADLKAQLGDSCVGISQIASTVDGGEEVGDIFYADDYIFSNFNFSMIEGEMVDTSKTTSNYAEILQVISRNSANMLEIGQSIYVKYGTGDQAVNVELKVVGIADFADNVLLENGIMANLVVPDLSKFLGYQVAPQYGKTMQICFKSESAKMDAIPLLEKYGTVGNATEQINAEVYKSDLASELNFYVIVSVISAISVFVMLTMLAIAHTMYCMPKTKVSKIMQYAYVWIAVAVSLAVEAMFLLGNIVWNTFDANSVPLTATIASSAIVIIATYTGILVGKLRVKKELKNDKNN